MKGIYNKILIAVDGSDLSIAAAEQGIALGRQQDAEISFIYAVDDSFLFNTTEGFGTPSPVPTDTSNMLESMMAGAYNLLDKLEKQAEKECGKFVEQGSPKGEILQKANDLHCDLIVLGTHGRSGLEHVIMGSVAEYVLRHSTCPVLVIPAAA